MDVHAPARLSWGILGCAAIADLIIPAIRQSETGELTAIASRSADKAAAAARKAGIPRHYGSYEALLADPDIQAVYIPLPNDLHREWVVRAAEAGKHVLCEKPFALNAREAADMAEAGRRCGVAIAEGFMYRHHPRYQRAIELLRSGLIGEIRSLRAAFTFDLSGRGDDIRFKAEAGGGSLYDDGCYVISGARLLLQAEPEAVTVHSMYSPGHGGVDMMNTALLEFPGGVGAVLEFGMWCDGRNVIEVLGSRGSLIMPDAFYYDPPASARLVVNAGGKRTEETFPAMDHYRREIDDFGRAVLDGRAPLYGTDDAVANMRVLDACRRSSSGRTRVPLPIGADVIL